MDANRRCRKRKQPLSSSGSLSSHRVPFGVSTRSKTISLLHCNDSGCGSPSNSESQYFQMLLTVPTKGSNRQCSDEDDNLLIKDLVLKSKKDRVACHVDKETSRGLVKDLRLRRVFSLKSSSGFHEKSVEDENAKEEGSALDLDSTIVAEDCGGNDEKDVATGEFHKGFCSESQNNNEVNSTLPSILEEYRAGEQNGTGLYGDEKDIGESEVNKNLGPLASCETEKNKDGGNGQDIVQATPPDAESFGTLEGYENETARLGRALQTANIVANNKCNEGNNTCSDVERRVKHITTKTMFMPRLQRRLFKVPGSFSYRRLLPFLMNVTANNSGSMKFHVHQEDEKDVHKKPTQPSLLSEYPNISADEFQKFTHRPDDFLVSRALPKDPSTNSDNLSTHDKPKLTSCQGLPESSIYLGVSQDTSNAIHKGDLVQLVDEHSKHVEMDCKESFSNKLGDEFTSAPSNQPDKNVFKVIPPNEFKYLNDDSFRPEDRVTSISAVNQFGEQNETSHNYCDAKQVIHGGNTISTTTSSPSNLAKLNHGTPNLPEGEENKMVGIAKKRSANPEISNYVDGWTEELAPVSTSIHAKIQSGPKSKDTFHMDDMVRGNIDLASRQALYKSSDFHDTRKCSNTKALNPCSRPKVFKISGSFSYRRLLPYLKEIANEDNQPMELEKEVEGRNHGLPIPASEDKVFPGVNTATTALALQDKLCMDETFSANVSNASSPNESLKINQFQDQHVLLEGDGRLEFLPEPTISSQHQDQHVLLEGDGQLECLPETTISSHELLAMQLVNPAKNGCFSKENAVSSSQMSLNHKLICRGFNSDSGKSYAGDTNSQDHCQVTAYDTPGTTISASGKGILKRNPRGCRGLCLCLNCASFRLNAEKAFDFSKNQMLDTEEVALDLIKQLTSLRKMLQKSANSDDQSFIHLDQVKDACQKATEAEELAKLRINRMREDLNIHCRITCLQEPRVRFSSRVEEIAISKADVPGNSIEGVHK